MRSGWKPTERTLCPTHVSAHSAPPARSAIGLPVLGISQTGKSLSAAVVLARFARQAAEVQRACEHAQGRGHDPHSGHTSPRTGATLPNKNLIPNHSLRFVVESWIEENENRLETQPSLHMTAEQQLGARITDLMNRMYYPPDGDLLRRASEQQVREIWARIVGHDKWKAVLKQNGRKHKVKVTTVAELTEMLLLGTAEPVDGECKARRLALAFSSGMKGILPEVLIGVR